ncbi:MAG TPA: SRPBCC family protein [Acidimicrobiales bacterium]|nr:SRPBCC family protein [Acidimicrobiales bacterium]
MARIEKTIEIDRSPGEVWNVVGDVYNIADWLPALSASKKLDNGNRQCTMEGGGDLEEEITSVDDANRRLEYTITTAPMPIDSHRATMEVADNDGSSTVTWVTEVTPDEIGPALEPMFDQGLVALKERLEG